MKRIIFGISIGLVIGILSCFIFLNIVGDSIDSSIHCSKPEFIYYVSQIIGVIVTFLAVVVALFGNEIRARLFRPKCKISLANDGFDERLGDTDNSTSPRSKFYDCILNVVNTGSKEISNCELIITEVVYMSDHNQKKGKKLLTNGHQSLYWFNKEHKKIHLIQGEQREVCLFRIFSNMQTPDGGEESPLHIGISGYNLDAKFSHKGIWKVKYKLQTNEQILHQFCITVDWSSGKWFDRISEMSNEVSVELNKI